MKWLVYLWSIVTAVSAAPQFFFVVPQHFASSQQQSDISTDNRVPVVIPIVNGKATPQTSSTQDASVVVDESLSGLMELFQGLTMREITDALRKSLDDRGTINGVLIEKATADDSTSQIDNDNKLGRTSLVDATVAEESNNLSPEGDVGTSSHGQNSENIADINSLSITNNEVEKEATVSELTTMSVFDSIIQELSSPEVTTSQIESSVTSKQGAASDSTNIKLKESLTPFLSETLKENTTEENIIQKVSVKSEVSGLDTDVRGSDAEPVQEIITVPTHAQNNIVPADPAENEVNNPLSENSFKEAFLSDPVIEKIPNPAQQIGNPHGEEKLVSELVEKENINSIVVKPSHEKSDNSDLLQNIITSKIVHENENVSSVSEVLENRASISESVKKEIASVKPTQIEVVDSTSIQKLDNATSEPTQNALIEPNNENIVSEHVLDEVAAPLSVHTEDTISLQEEGKITKGNTAVPTHIASSVSQGNENEIGDAGLLEENTAVFEAGLHSGFSNLIPVEEENAINENSTKPILPINLEVKQAIVNKNLQEDRAAQSLKEENKVHFQEAKRGKSLLQGKEKDFSFTETLKDVDIIDQSLQKQSTLEENVQKISNTEQSVKEVFGIIEPVQRDFNFDEEMAVFINPHKPDTGISDPEPFGIKMLGQADISSSGHISLQGDEKLPGASSNTNSKQEESVLIDFVNEEIIPVALPPKDSMNLEPSQPTVQEENAIQQPATEAVVDIESTADTSQQLNGDITGSSHQESAVSDHADFSKQISTVDPSLELFADTIVPMDPLIDTIENTERNLEETVTANSANENIFLEDTQEVSLPDVVSNENSSVHIQEDSVSPNTEIFKSQQTQEHNISNHVEDMTKASKNMQNKFNALHSLENAVFTPESIQNEASDPKRDNVISESAGVKDKVTTSVSSQNLINVLDFPQGEVPEEIISKPLINKVPIDTIQEPDISIVSPQENNTDSVSIQKEDFPNSIQTEIINDFVQENLLSEKPVKVEMQVPDSSSRVDLESTKEIITLQDPSDETIRDAEPIQEHSVVLQPVQKSILTTESTKSSSVAKTQETKSVLETTKENVTVPKSTTETNTNQNINENGNTSNEPVEEGNTVPKLSLKSSTVLEPSQESNSSLKPTKEASSASIETAQDANTIIELEQDISPGVELTQSIVASKDAHEKEAIQQNSQGESIIIEQAQVISRGPEPIQQNIATNQVQENSNVERLIQDSVILPESMPEISDASEPGKIASDNLELSNKQITSSTRKEVNIPAVILQNESDSVKLERDSVPNSNQIQVEVTLDSEFTPTVSSKKDAGISESPSPSIAHSEPDQKNDTTLEITNQDATNSKSTGFEQNLQETSPGQALEEINVQPLEQIIDIVQESILEPKKELKQPLSAEPSQETSDVNKVLQQKLISNSGTNTIGTGDRGIEIIINSKQDNSAVENMSNVPFKSEASVAESLTETAATSTSIDKEIQDTKSVTVTTEILSNANSNSQALEKSVQETSSPLEQNLVHGELSNVILNKSGVEHKNEKVEKVASISEIITGEQSKTDAFTETATERDVLKIESKPISESVASPELPILKTLESTSLVQGDQVQQTPGKSFSPSQPQESGNAIPSLGSSAKSKTEQFQIETSAGIGKSISSSASSKSHVIDINPVARHFGFKNAASVHLSKSRNYMHHGAFVDPRSLVAPQFRSFIYSNDAPEVIAAKVAFFRIQERIMSTRP